MPCESCGVQFSVFRRKRACSECERLYCAACLRRGGGMCAPCRALSTRPLQRLAIAHLKARDLQCFLQRQNVSTRGCVEKEELVSLCVSHVNSAAYRRRGPRYSPGPFTSLKGLTTNFNDFLNSAFDLRGAPATSPDNNSNCFNSAHVHAPHVTTGAPTAPPAASRERFTVAPGGERDVREPAPGGAEPGAPGGGASRSDSSVSAHVDTADCFEIEDLDDAGWEFVTRPADPLPNDSEVLMTAPEADGRGPEGRGGSDGGERPRSPEARGGGAAFAARASAAAAVRLSAPGGSPEGAGGTPVRAASELELHRSESADTADSASLQDEPLMDHEPETTRPAPVSLEQVRQAEELSALSVRQLKELLARNRVEYRGCLERADLLQRATTLWRDHAKYRDVIDNLPIEECCKICMAAPLECVLLECGHIAACTRCAKQLAECPICRQYVVRAVRFFRS